MEKCSICLLDFKLNDNISLLNKCGHKFHSECLNIWISQKNVCPFCKNTIRNDFSVLLIKEKLKLNIIIFYESIIFRSKNYIFKDFLYKNLLKTSIHNNNIVKLVFKSKLACFGIKKTMKIQFMSNKDLNDFISAYHRFTQGSQNLNYWEGCITNYKITV
jgi:hypothetical protein